MANIGFYKVLNTLPVQIENDSFYLVSDSDRFDLYVTSNGVIPTAVRLANVKHLQEDTVPDPNDYYEGDEWLDVLTMTKYKLYYDGTKKIWVEVGNNPMMNPDLVYEAPTDGQQYARKDGEWEIVDVGDTSKWEDDGATLVRPKDGKKVDASHIEGLEQGGHVFEDSTDNILPTRSVAKAGDGIEFEDDEVGEKTVVRASKNLTDHIDGEDEKKHTANQIHGGAADDNKIYYVDPTTKKLTPSSFTVQQILQLSSIDVTEPDWQVGEQRLVTVEKTIDEEPSLKGATQLVDLVLPPTTVATLGNATGWVGETRTLTGANFFGELGKVGQRGTGEDGTIYVCTAAVAGGQGQTNGSATFKRNRSVDALDPDNNTNDSNIAILLDPTRVGGNADTNWDVVNNVLIINTLVCRVGTWFTSGTGYFFMCYDRVGTNFYWRRIGQPQAIHRPINAATYPTLTSNLLAHDFTTGAYQNQSGDETNYQDQTFYDATTRRLFWQVKTGIWEEITINK